MLGIGRVFLLGFSYLKNGNKNEPCFNKCASIQLVLFKVVKI